MSEERILKRVDFISSARKNLKEFPEEVKQDIDLIRHRFKMAEEDYDINYR